MSWVTTSLPPNPFGQDNVAFCEAFSPISYFVDCSFVLPDDPLSFRIVFFPASFSADSLSFCFFGHPPPPRSGTVLQTPAFLLGWFVLGD